MANSKKLGDRCVAGPLKGGTWIRPVGAKRGGALTPEQCLLDTGRPVQPLDLVRLKVLKQEPQPHQPENWLVADQPWELVRKEKRRTVSIFLTACEFSDKLPFGTDDDKVSWTQVDKHGIDKSLILVRVARPEFYRKKFMNKAQIRVEFTYAGIEYDLSVTFESQKLLTAGKSHKRSSRDWWFTISLGEPFQPYGSQERYCYKLVAGAMKIP